MSSWLEAKSISKSFGGVCALQEVSAHFEPGEVHALMGENGAGKSTLGKILAGATPLDEGEIFVRGERAAIANPLDAQRAGISIIHQELDLFPHLTVAENMACGNLNYTDPPLVSGAKLAHFCRPFLEQVGLKVDPGTYVGRLPIGQMQLVAIARSLSMQAKVIIMDESTSSLTDEAVENLFAIIDRLRESGVTIVYVSHKLDEVFRICDRVTVLRDGQHIATHRVDEIDRAEVIRLMVGREITENQRTLGAPHRETIFSATDLTTDKLQGVSFELHAGEILGVAGLVGAGRSEVSKALFGLDPIRGGRMSLKGASYTPRSPREAMNAGLGLLPEDRKSQGLMMQMSVLENAGLAVLGRYSRWGWIDRLRERAEAHEAHRKMSLKAASPEIPVHTLSGGNQQKVLLSRWLMVDPDVYFLDDPTRGVDVGAKEEIYEIIEKLASDGKGVLMVSSELPELLRCSHRILVLQDGRCRGILDRYEATQERILELATHVDESPREAPYLKTCGGAN